MKKSDLKTGMRVELSNGSLYMIIKDIDSKLYGHQKIALINNSGFLRGESYDDDLNFIMDKDYDIVKVYTINEYENGLLSSETLKFDKKYLIWTRKEPIKMTVKEIEEKIGYKIEIVK